MKSEEQRLVIDLFQNYSKLSRPVLDKNAQVVVTFRAKLKQIIDLVSTYVKQRFVSNSLRRFSSLFPISDNLSEHRTLRSETIRSDEG